jgi:hypothetical protein
MRFRIEHIFLVLIVFCPCYSRKPKLPESNYRVLQRIGNIDVDPEHYQSDAEYHKQTDQQIKAIVGDISSPVVLKMLFYACWQKADEEAEAPQEKLTWIVPYDEACDIILFHLAALDSDEATRVLMELFADENLRYDGEGSLNICNAVSRCGPRALPYLKKMRSGRWKHTVPQIIACIEKGELYGP